MQNMLNFVHDREATPHISDDELGEKKNLIFNLGMV